MSVAAVCGMSVLLYAGSAQFLTAGMLAGGAGFLPITVAVFFINLRHFLMSAALAPRLRRFGPGRLAVFAHELTDESFAVHSAGFAGASQPPFTELVALNAAAQLAWVASTAAGAAAGNLLPDPAALGLDFALPAMFLGLLAGQARDGRRVLAAVTAAVLAVAGALVLPGNWNVIIAAAAAAGVGAMMR